MSAQGRDSGLLMFLFLFWFWFLLFGFRSSTWWLKRIGQIGSSKYRDYLSATRRIHTYTNWQFTFSRLVGRESTKMLHINGGQTQQLRCLVRAVVAYEKWTLHPSCAYHRSIETVASCELMKEARRLSEGVVQMALRHSFMIYFTVVTVSVVDELQCA